jgi:cellulose synthase/poly-beta-1,6-N-acetylglucosamine synthase-like glycosyltransferase
MNREMKIKYNEGIIYGASMGVFGALYAIRKEAFNAIPKNYNVDDFFVSMNVLKDGKKVIFTNDAIADETLTGNLNEEFRRKVRIATGNFQNLKHFFPILFYFWKPVSYIFISHKVIRWLGPFLLLFILISLSMLIEFNVYKYLLGGVIFIAVLSILEMILSLMKINIKNLRFITHFLTMNIALAVGFFKFVFGNKSGIWEPSKRN